MMRNSVSGWRAALALLLGALAPGAAWAAIEVMHEDSERIILQLEDEAEPLYEIIDRLARGASLVDVGADSSWLRAGTSQRRQDWLEPLGRLTGRDDLNQQRCRSEQLELPDWPYMQTVVGKHNYTYRFLVTCAGQHALVELVSGTADPNKRDLYIGVRRLQAGEIAEHRYSRQPTTRPAEGAENLLTDQPATRSQEEAERFGNNQQPRHAGSPVPN